MITEHWEPPSTSELLAAAQRALYDAGFKDITPDTETPSGYDNARLLQNDYSIAMVATFETWESLSSTWPDYQDMTVKVMSSFLNKEDPKAWDGYLVLLTPSFVPQDAVSEANRIRSDTLRLRKLLGTGDDLKTISDVRKVISSLLPLSIDEATQSEGSGLDALPRVLKQHGIPPEATKVVIDSFKANTPMMQRLHEHVLKQ